jgi:hypothetical protein
MLIAPSRDRLSPPHEMNVVKHLSAGEMVGNEMHCRCPKVLGRKTDELQVAHSSCASISIVSCCSSLKN